MREEKNGMSEIFDFLKKTETARKRSSVYPMSGADTAAFIPSAAIAGAESFGQDTFGQDSFETPPVSVTQDIGDEEFLPAEKFDFSLATNQMQSAMNPRTVLGEQCRVLRTKLTLLQKQNGIRTILITSTVPQEGKSFTSCALAGIIAQEQRKRVVIIDADLRKHGSGRDYGINGNSGIAGTSEVLQGTSEFRRSLLKSIDPEFWFLPSGTLPPNPSELLSSPEMEKTLRFAARNFDWVIIDAPPALALSDPTLIAPLCDAVVLVVRVNSTPAKLVQETINRIGRERICGIVLNRQKLAHSSRYYYQYYYQKIK
jgi:capsular exopolysaccharide synthesis family protein